MLLRNLTLSLLVVGGAVALSHSASGQILSGASGYTMKMKFVKGTKTNYAITMSMSGVPNAPAMKPIPFSMTVKDVKNGVATIEFSGASMPSGSTIKMNANGKVVGGTASNLGMGSSLTGASLPTKPVKVGDTWKHTETADTPAGKMNMSSTYKFLGVKNISGKQVAEIGLTIAGSGSMMKIDGSGTMRLLTADSSLFSATINQNMKMTGSAPKGQPTNVKMTISIARK